MSVINTSYRFPFAAYPAIRLVLLFAAGVTVDYHLEGMRQTWAWLFFGTVILYLVGELIHAKFLNTAIHHASLLFYLCAVICFGGLWHSLFDARDVPVEAETINKYRWETLNFKGRSLSNLENGRYKCLDRCGCRHIVFPGGLALGRLIQFANRHGFSRGGASCRA